MEPAEQWKLRRLSFDFSKSVSQDIAKRNLLPAKWLLEGMLAWPDNNNQYIAIFNWFCFFNLLIAEIFHTAYLFAYFSDLQQMPAVCTTVITTLEATVRIAIIILKRRELNHILFTIWQVFWPADILTPPKLAAVKLRMIFSLSLNFGFLVSGSISNTQIVGVPLLKHDLILKSLLPLDWNQSFVYELTYMWQYFLDWYVLFMVTAFDFLLIAIVMNCVAQYMVMQEVFRHMLGDAFQKSKTTLFGIGTLSNTDVLIRCLEQHKKLNRVCEQLENCFAIIILIQFFNSTIAICVSSIVMRIDPHQLIQMFTFLSGHLFQLFYYCFVGNELIFQSLHLSDAIYESNWHLTSDKEFCRILLLMMQRSQRKQCLTAAGITEMDFASYLKVLRISFSFYTALDTLMKKKVKQN